MRVASDPVFNYVLLHGMFTEMSPSNMPIIGSDHLCVRYRSFSLSVSSGGQLLQYVAPLVINHVIIECNTCVMWRMRVIWLCYFLPASTSCHLCNENHPGHPFLSFHPKFLTRKMASLILYVKSSISLYSCSCKRFRPTSCITQFFHSADRWSKTWKRGNALFIVKVHVATLKQFEVNNTNNITGIVLTSTVRRHPVGYTQAWSRNLISRRPTNKSTKQSERDWNPGSLSSRPRCFTLLNHRTPNMEYFHFSRLTFNTVFISSSN